MLQNSKTLLTRGKDLHDVNVKCRSNYDVQFKKKIEYLSVHRRYSSTQYFAK